MPRDERIIRYLPDLYRTVYPAALILKVIDALGTKLEQVENALFEVMRAHWVDHADVLDDLTRLGALFDIRRREGEGLDTYRQRLKRTIAAYLAGVGTVQVVRDIAAATLGVAEEDYDLIRIIENPPRLVTSEWREVPYQGEWQVTVEGFEELDDQGRPKEIRPTIRIVGIGQKTANPIVLNATTGVLVGFQGFVHDGETLSIHPDGTATLGDADASSRVYALTASLFDQACFDRDYFSTDSASTPALPRGTSTWRYLAESARFAPPDSPFSRFDQAMFAIPVARAGVFDWVGFDESSFAIPAARVQLQWVECQPATFVVRMPWTIIEPPQEGPDPRHLVKEEVEKVRAAGVRAIIQYTFGPDVLEERQSQQALMRWQTRLTGRERQEQEDRLRLASRVTLVEEQRAAEELTFAGLFDTTYFDSSRFI